jgi:hypothetical protein
LHTFPERTLDSSGGDSSLELYGAACDHFNDIDVRIPDAEVPEEFDRVEDLRIELRPVILIYKLIVLGKTCRDLNPIPIPNKAYLKPDHCGVTMYIT